MTWAELIKAKDMAWVEYMTANVHVTGPDVCQAMFINYRWWQGLVDSYDRKSLECGLGV